jgi:hypothetical protein
MRSSATLVKRRGQHAFARTIAPMRIGERLAFDFFATLPLRKAAWSVNMSEQAAPRRDVARQAEFPRLLGTWVGKETARSTGWTLVFSDRYRVAARSNTGESYEGESMIRWDLGVEGGSIRVPPGWGPLDVEVDKASHPDAVGKVALAAFSLGTDELRFCGGPPGLEARVKSFESPGPQFRCMVLRKAAAGRY